MNRAPAQAEAGRDLRGVEAEARALAPPVDPPQLHRDLDRVPAAGDGHRRGLGLQSQEPIGAGSTPALHPTRGGAVVPPLAGGPLAGSSPEMQSLSGLSLVSATAARPRLSHPAMETLALGVIDRRTEIIRQDLDLAAQYTADVGQQVGRVAVTIWEPSFNHA